MQPACLSLRVIPGATLRKPLLLLQPTYTYKPIEAFEQSAPLRFSVPAHGLPGDWPTWIEGSTGWSGLNKDKVREAFRVARVIDENTLEYNELNGLDQSARGGQLVYQLPVDLTGIRARLVIVPEQGPPMELTTENNGLLIAGLGQLVLVLTDGQTAAITWSKAEYTLDITWSNGDVSRWLHGPVELGNGGCCRG
ncbi:hypothetical protein [Phytopseudomonas punonensis]|uniref:Uncharacterized protein n=1 Tax=Phytopseudomonas punonensis TaxID=1220495 RepID=A0A1M7LEM2_9GAMM|nr:hypothetical protein [Pseudomonas punonensis]SHM76400.1 hypothetical protein SAMN05216288_4237 [Pseudomonas punonensis]